MPDPVTGLIVGGSTIGGGLINAYIQSEAAEDAARAQERGITKGVEAQKMGIEETRRQFDALQEILAPYREAGETALTGQQALLGLAGEEAQQAEISKVMQSPLFETLQSQAQEGLLAQGSATGGLRGGNIRSAMAELNPQILNQLLEDRYSKLGGLTTLGASTASNIGQAGMQAGRDIGSSYRNIGGLYGDIGGVRAAEAMAKGQGYADIFGNLQNLAGMYAAGKSGGKF